MSSQKLSAAQFVTLIRRHAGEPNRATDQDPLSAARAFIAERQNSAESCAIARVMEMVRTGCGEFDESDIYFLGSRALVIADALIEASMMGRL